MNIVAELKRRNVVRVAVAYLVVGWLLMQLAALLEAALTLPPWFDTVVVAFLALGLPIALFLSWAYEMTPEGVKKTEEVDTDASITRSTGQKLNYFIIIALVIAVGFLLYDRNSPSGDTIPVQTADAKKSIAVLPFANMSDDPSQEFFADGIAEEILNRLARTEDLTVISRSSSFTFKGRNVSIPEVAATLNVTHVLEGSVRRTENRVRITAQLIEASSDAHLWSETFDRELTDIFALEDEIAGAIANALTVTLGFGPAAGSYDNMADYDLMLRGRALMGTRNLDKIIEAKNLFEELVQRAPGLADGLAHLAFTTMLVTSYDYDMGETETQERHEISANQARRALDLDGRNVTALVTLAAIVRSLFELEEANRLGELALEISPNSSRANNWHGDFLNMTMQHEEAIRVEQKAVDLDPLLAVNHSNLGDALFSAGQTELAINAYHAALEIDPIFELAVHELSLVYMREGMNDELAEFLRTSEYGWANGEKEIYEKISQGKREQALALLEIFVGQEGLATWGTWIYTALGEYELAANVLLAGKIATENAVYPSKFPTDPEILLANPNYASYWRAYPRSKLVKARGHWPAEWDEEVQE